MASVILRRGAQAIKIQTAGRSVSSSVDGEPDWMWQTRPRQSARELSQLLHEMLFDEHGVQGLRTLLTGDEHWAASRLDEHSVIHQVASLIASRHLILLDKVLTPQAQERRGLSRMPTARYVPAEPAAFTPVRGQRVAIAEPPTSPASAPAPSAPKQDTHWIEIQLVGEDDLPLGGERYLVLLPNGKEVEGRLDDAGLARVDGIAETADCKVTFPDLDTQAWEPA